MVALAGSNVPGPAEHWPAWVQLLAKVRPGVELAVAAVAEAGMLHPHLVDVEQYDQVSPVQPHQNTNILIDKGPHRGPDTLVRHCLLLLLERIGCVERRDAGHRRGGSGILKHVLASGFCFWLRVRLVVVLSNRLGGILQVHIIFTSLLLPPLEPVVGLGLGLEAQSWSVFALNHFLLLVIFLDALLALLLFLLLVIRTENIASNGKLLLGCDPSSLIDKLATTSKASLASPSTAASKLASTPVVSIKLRIVLLLRLRLIVTLGSKVQMIRHPRLLKTGHFGQIITPRQNCLLFMTAPSMLMIMVLMMERRFLLLLMSGMVLPLSALVPL